MAEMVTVTLRRRWGSGALDGVLNLKETGIVEGELIAPGLAITPQLDRPGYSLTHTASGLAFVSGYCETHIRQAAERTLAAGADWTVDAAELTGEAQRVTLRQVVESIRDELGFECPLRCYHGDVPTCRVRCNTCDWYVGDDHDEWMDVKTAKEAANDHQCEPDVQIQVPGDDEWFYTFQVNDDGSTVPRTEKRRQG